MIAGGSVLSPVPREHDRADESPRQSDSVARGQSRPVRHVEDDSPARVYRQTRGGVPVLDVDEGRGASLRRVVATERGALLARVVRSRHAARFVVREVRGFYALRGFDCVSFVRVHGFLSSGFPRGVRGGRGLIVGGTARM